MSVVVAATQAPYDEQALFARLPVSRWSEPVDAFTSGSDPLLVVIA